LVLLVIGDGVDLRLAIEAPVPNSGLPPEQGGIATGTNAVSADRPAQRTLAGAPQVVHRAEPVTS
jgi:hypothetical protein